MKIDNDLSRILMVFLALTTSTLLSCIPTNEDVPVTDNEAEITGGPPPLVVNTSTPLLLNEPTGAEEASAVTSTRASVENTACFVCHANYKTESLTDRHAKADIGCVNCHGESSAHRNDENNITPPEIMYSAEKIDPFCQDCHEAHDISPKKIIARWVKRKADKTDSSCRGCHEDDDVPPEKVVARWTERGLEKTDPNEIVCTDCHGDHRMRIRTVIWDKKSGKLLRTNRGD